MENEVKTKYRRSSDYIYREIAGSHVLISVGANIADFNGYIQLNETAAFLWQLLEKPRTAAELCEELCREFDVSKDSAEADIAEMLDTALEHGLVFCDG